MPPKKQPNFSGAKPESLFNITQLALSVEKTAIERRIQELESNLEVISNAIDILSEVKGIMPKQDKFLGPL